MNGMDLRRARSLLLTSFLICILKDGTCSSSNNDSITFIEYCHETCDNPIKECRCDGDCLLYGDCCKDKYDNFTNIEISESETPTESCTDISGFSYFIFRNCSSSWNDDGNWRQLCEQDSDVHDILLDLPVYDQDGKHYRNMACAVCNNIPLENILSWDVSTIEYRFNIISSDYGDSTTDSNTHGSNYYYTPPGLPEPHSPRTCDNRLIINECENKTHTCPDYYSPVTFHTLSGYYRYKNPDCGTCNGFEFDYLSMCFTNEGRVDMSVDMSDSIQYDVGLDGHVGIKELIAFAPESETREELYSYTCDDGEVFDPYIDTCIKLYCQEGLELVGDQCVRKTTTCPLWILRFDVTSIGATISINDTLLCLLSYLPTTDELSQITSYLSVDNGDLQQVKFEVSSILDYSSLSNYLSYLFTPSKNEPILCNVKSLQIDQFCVNKPDNCSTDGIDIFTATDDGNQTMIFVNQSQTFISPDESLFRYMYLDNDGEFNSTTRLYLCSRDVDGLSCPFILDDLNNYVILNGTLEHIESGTIYDHEFYQLVDNQTVKICSTFNQSGTVTTAYYFVQYNDVQTILSLIGCIVSLIALSLTFLVYCLLPPLRTLPGKSVMSLAIALFCAQFLLTFGANQTQNTLFCKVIAVTMHFFWLASFFWMNVLAYDVSKTFNNTVDRSKGNKIKTFAKYSIVAWGLPCVIVAVCLTLSMEVESLDFEYGSTSICWISDAVVSLVIFGGPVILILFMNIIFFGLTVHGVRDTMKTSSILHRSSKAKTAVTELKIYLKITSLMGFSWIFGFIATFTDVEVLWYLFIILGSLQGVFIFFSFVCNVRVYSLLRQKLDSKWWSRGETSTSMTTSSRITSI